MEVVDNFIDGLLLALGLFKDTSLASLVQLRVVKPMKNCDDIVAVARIVVVTNPGV